MIELTFTPDIIKNHWDMVFGKNKNDSRRLYSKLKELVDNEKQIIRKRIFKWLLDNLEPLVIGNLDILNLAVTAYKKMTKPLTTIDQEYILNKLDIFLKEYVYFKKAKAWNAYKLLKSLEVIICPYCNSQFTFIYQSSTGKTRATIDHFFDQDSYPFLAISLYNLVPSCKICNSDLKHTKAVNLNTHYSPFETGIEKRLTIKREIVKASKLISNCNSNSEDYVGTILGANEDFNIIFDFDENEEYYGNKIKGNIELFHLEKIYNAFHKDYVKDIIKKAIIYNEVYINQLTTSNTLIFNNENNLHTSLFNVVTEDKKKLLGKLTRDIIKNELNKN
ncbi:hypothetical protein [Bacillus wiedmannii]|uniref:HNH endonuclease n=1 Tax=Bacillus wiedmannii TaxID=1890302 RepID=A0ABD6TH79_9BACI|nr:hypothetical protein [Bacillus wiedmannii]MCP9280760.1 hypothetical protein [Bacillus wiedmannii]PEN50364.1 hypothetical protein CN630_04765 [Bacillus wiedmannii]PEO59681.1 hypothetical protein CN560_08865 [Bacillus wiedmannii]PEO94525.1 hypothetical protein CN554_21900 [Bacillus wiedmannii]PGC73720.1 hypothetical protein COM25_18140 [Bacillus wiedmannii]